MKRFLLVSLIFLPLCACSPVTMGIIDSTPRPPFTGDFTIVHPDQKFDHKYLEVAVLTYECGAPDAALQIAEMVKRARLLGCQALLLEDPTALTHRQPGGNPNWCQARAVLITDKP